MEDTQAIDWDAEEEETEQSNESLGHSLEPVGQLRIFSGTHGPEKDFPLYLGKNMVGRSAECAVALPFPSISKQHAVIEILAWNKAPILQDCGSLNGTQILRPPKVLSPGVSHRLRDKELILFADFPCQYHRLDVPQPFVSRGPLTVEETPRVQGGTQPSPLLVEDSEEEVDFVSEKCVVKKSQTTSSPLPTVVPESDEEGPSPAPGGSRTSFPFNLDSDTDEEKDQQLARGEPSLASRKDATAEAEQPEASEVPTTSRLVKAQSSVENDQEAKVEVNVQNGGILERSQPPKDNGTAVDEGGRSPGRPADVHLERAQASGFVDSDTDMEEEGIPATPAVVPMKRRQIFHGVGTKDPGAPRVQESETGSGTNAEEDEALLAVPAERNQTSIVINSDTDDEEEVSAALTLACLKENGSVLWNRGTGMGEDKVQPVVLQEQSHIDSGGESDTDMEEECLSVDKKETVPDDHTHTGGTLITGDSGKGQPSFKTSDVDEKTEVSSSGIHLQRSQTSTVVNNNTEMEEEVPSGLVVTNQEPRESTDQTDMEAEGSLATLPVVPVEETGLPDENWDTDMKDDQSSIVADVKKNQHLAKETPRAVEVLEQEQSLEVGPQSGSPVAGVEQVLLHPMEPTQSQREGAQTPTGRGKKAHTGRTKDSRDNDDDTEDMDLQATQCFVERENQSMEAVQKMEDEPTQAFTFTLPPEPSPSHCSFQTPGAPDEPWEVLATQPFCLGEAEVSEPQPIAAHFEVPGSCQSPPRAVSKDQHPESPVHTTPLEMEGKGMQTVEKGMDTPKRTEERMQPERWLSEREIKEWPSDREREDVIGEKELAREIQNREQNQVLAGNTQTQESDTKVERVNPKRDGESLEMETSKEIQENKEEKQALTREVLERQEDKPVTNRKCKPAGLEVTLDRGEADKESQNQKGEATSPIPESRMEAGNLQGLTSGPIVSESQPGSRKRALVSSRRQHRGPSIRKMPAAKKASRGDPKSPDACLPQSEASSSPQSPGHLPPQPFLPPSPSSSEAPILSKRHSGSQEVPETPLSSEPFHPKHTVRPRRSSRMTSSPLSTAPTTPTDQPIPPEPTSQATRKSSVKTSEPVVPIALELQSSTAHTSYATWGRALRSSVKTPGPVVPTGLELQSCTSTVQLVTPKPTSHVTRGKTRRSSVQTPRPVAPTGPELQPATSTNQPVPPETVSYTTRGKTRRSSIQTPGPVAPTGPELQPSTVQPVIPKTTSEASQDRTHGSTVETHEAVVSTGSKLPSSPSTEQHPVTPEPTSRATRGRKNRSSVKTPEPVIPLGAELHPSTSVVQPVTPKRTSRTTRSRACKSSTGTSNPEPPTSTDHPVIPETITHGKTLNSLSLSDTPVLATSEVQPVPVDPIPQASCSRKQDAGKHGSLSPVNKPCPSPPEPKSQSSNNQRPGPPRAIESFGTIPETASPQLPEVPTHAPQNQKVKIESTSGYAPGPLPKSSQTRKRPSATEGSPPLQKRPQKTVFPKEEEDTVERPGKEEDTMIPGPGKRKRDLAEKEPKGMPSRSLRRAKPSQGPAPKVLFTGVVDARGERAVLALGGTLAHSVTEASHLVTDRIRRTVKFLCALGKGIPILSLDWLYQSRKAGHFLPPDKYLVTDPEQEENFGFSLRDALNRARERRLLEGYEIHVTPGVQPPPPQMGEIINCCGGTILSNMPRLYKPQRVVITCPQDFPRCSSPSRVGLPLLSSEFLLTGVLKQEAKPEDFVFSDLKISST